MLIAWGAPFCCDKWKVDFYADSERTGRLPPGVVEPASIGADEGRAALGTDGHCQVCAGQADVITLHLFLCIVSTPFTVA